MLLPIVPLQMLSELSETCRMFLRTTGKQMSLSIAGENFRCYICTQALDLGEIVSETDERPAWSAARTSTTPAIVIVSCRIEVLPSMSARRSIAVEASAGRPFWHGLSDLAQTVVTR